MIENNPSEVRGTPLVSDLRPSGLPIFYALKPRNMARRTEGFLCESAADPKIKSDGSIWNGK